jgi:hypothetical protein
VPNINVNLPEQLVDITGGSVTVSGGTIDVTQASGDVLDVNVVNGPSPSNIATPLVYNEITSVASGVETQIAIYTAPATGSSYLVQIEAAGTNNGIYIVYRNASVIDKKYTTYGTPLDLLFTFETGYSSVPGVILAPGDTVSITVTQNNASLGTFNAKIQAVEVS